MKLVFVKWKAFKQSAIVFFEVSLFNIFQLKKSLKY